jgi:hypothetical protein
LRFPARTFPVTRSPYAPSRTIPIPQPGLSLDVFEGTVRLLFETNRFRRTIVQRPIAVDVIVGIGLRFAPASQVPSCGGGGSLSEELRLIPTASFRKSESSKTKWPPELVPA